MRGADSPQLTSTEPRWLDAVEMRAWRNLIEIVAELEGDLGADLAASQHMTVGDYQVLVYLSEAPGHSMRMCDLATRLQLSPSGSDTAPRRAGSQRLRRPAPIRWRPSGDHGGADGGWGAAAHGGRARSRRPRPASHARSHEPIRCRAAGLILERLRADAGGNANQPRHRPLRAGTTEGVSTPLPLGFRCHVANIGIKDASDDFVVVAADRPCPAAGVFTRSRFAGPSVVVSREHLARSQGTRRRGGVEERERRHRCRGAGERPRGRRRRRRGRSAATRNSC